jgi:hypothetical protein
MKNYATIKKILILAPKSFSGGHESAPLKKASCLQCSIFGHEKRGLIKALFL